MDLSYENHFELPQNYIQFSSLIKTQFSLDIKIFCTNNTMEYRDSKLCKFLSTHGTIIQCSCRGTSQWNGRAERKHKHIVDTVRDFLLSSTCLKSFWGEAAITMVYTIN